MGNARTTPLAQSNSIREVARRLNDGQIGVGNVSHLFHLPDHEIRLDNGWVIKIRRGLDFYQKPGS